VSTPPQRFDEDALARVSERLARVHRRRVRTSLIPPPPNGKPVRAAAVLVRSRSPSLSLATKLSEYRVVCADLQVPLCNRNGRASVLFTLRAASLTLHNSEVAFPGGMEDPEDNGDPVVTAQRETMEELGVPTSAIRILGTYHQSLSKTKIPGTVCSRNATPALVP
jgi:8-oxo-dGTP pyrophosphatase MutT (NUDIX family)